MADAALISGLIDGLLSNLAPLIKDQFWLVWNFKKLSSRLSAIEAVLEDAERKTLREKDKQTEDWLWKLKDVLYEVRDIIEEWNFDYLNGASLRFKRLIASSSSSSSMKKVTNSLTFSFSNTSLIDSTIKDVREKLDQIYSVFPRLHLDESIPDSKINKFTSLFRQTTSFPCYNKVYGRDKEKKKIIDILLDNTSSSVKELSVLPIVGIGGLGKTTLAQMVFNDNEISEHFHPKIWITVSDEFDIKLIFNAILKEEKAGALLEELQENVTDKLRGKRYLIVLDDVWNEDEEAWIKLRSTLDCGSYGAFVLTTTRKGNVARIMETIQHFELSLLSDNDCWLLFEVHAFATMHET